MSGNIYVLLCSHCGAELLPSSEDDNIYCPTHGSQWLPPEVQARLQVVERRLYTMMHPNEEDTQDEDEEFLRSLFGEEE